MAMDLIMRDIANAASGLPPFVQAFTPGLDACALCPMGPDGVRTDELEMITNSESRDTEPICRTIGVSNSANVQLMRDVVTANPNPIPPNTLVIPFTANGQWTLRNLVSTTPSGAAVPGTACTAGAHTRSNLVLPDAATGLNTPRPLDPRRPAGATSPTCPVRAGRAELRQRRPVPDPPGRRPACRCWSAGARMPRGAIAGRRRNEAAFQTLARGIENMQVRVPAAPTATPAIPPPCPAIGSTRRPW